MNSIIMINDLRVKFIEINNILLMMETMCMREINCPQDEIFNCLKNLSLNNAKFSNEFNLKKNVKSKRRIEILEYIT